MSMRRDYWQDGDDDGYEKNVKMNENIRKRDEAKKTGIFTASFNKDNNKYYCPECGREEAGIYRDIGHRDTCILIGAKKYSQQSENKKGGTKRRRTITKRRRKRHTKRHRHRLRK
jgi:hypothetical protein